MSNNQTYLGIIRFKFEPNVHNIQGTLQELEEDFQLFWAHLAKVVRTDDGPFAVTKDNIFEVETSVLFIAEIITVVKRKLGSSITLLPDSDQPYKRLQHLKQKRSTP